MAKKSLIVFVILFYWAASGGGAAFKGKGSDSFTFLKINPSVKSSALAGSDCVTAVGLDAPFLNPAGLKADEGMGFYFNFTRWFDEINIGYASVVRDMGALGHMGFSAGYILYPSQKETEVDALSVYNYRETGSFNASGGFAGLSMSRKITDSVSAGWGAKVAGQSIGDYKTVATGVFDLGMIVYAPEHMRYGVSLNNISWGVKYSDSYEPLPALLRIGGKWSNIDRERTKYLMRKVDSWYSADRQWKYSLTFCSEFRFRGTIYIGTGLETSPSEYFSLRLGYNYALETEEQGGIAGLSAGFTLATPLTGTGLRLEYAMSSMGSLGLAHRVGLKIGA